MKRSESVMVIAGGVKPGDDIAMSDPFAKPGDKKKREIVRIGQARHAGLPVEAVHERICWNWFRAQDGALQPLRPQAS